MRRLLKNISFQNFDYYKSLKFKFSPIDYEWLKVFAFLKIKTIHYSNKYSLDQIKFQNITFIHLTWLGMITFICLKTMFSIFTLLSIFKLIKSNKVVYKPIKIENKKIKQNDLINQKCVSNFRFIKVCFI